MLPTNSKRHSAGFTLVELLVVLGIITLLLSMLLPTVTRVRGQAYSAKCAAQMRDVGLQLKIYSQSYRGWLFPVGEYVAPGAAHSPPPVIPAGTPDPDTISPYTAKKTAPVPSDPVTPAAASAGPLVSGSAAPAAPKAQYVNKTKVGYFRTLGVEREWDLAYPGSKYNKNGEFYRGRFLRWPNYVVEPGRWNPAILICPADFEPAEQHTYILNKHLASRMDKVIKAGGTIQGRSSSEVLLMGEKKTEVEDYYMGAKDESDPNASEFNIVEPYRHGLRLGSNYLYLDGHVELLPPKVFENAMDAWDVDVGTNPSTKPVP